MVTPCRCGNEARYTTSIGDRTCSLCAMLARVPAVRDNDLPALILAVAALMEDLAYGPIPRYGPLVAEIRSYLGRYK